MAKMELHGQTLLVNACVIAGLLLEYFRGAKQLVIAISAVLLLALINTIYWMHLRRAKKSL